MPLQILWDRLAELSVKFGMKCIRYDRCNSNCCRPAIGGGEPGVTLPEIALINNFLAKNSGFQFYEAGNDFCKFLGKNGKCRIYEVRPIDCRIHFCKDDSMASQLNEEVSNLVEDYHFQHESEFMATELIDSFKFPGER